LHARREGFGQFALGLRKGHVALTSLSPLDVIDDSLVPLTSAVVLCQLNYGDGHAASNDDNNRGKCSLGRQVHAWTMAPSETSGKELLLRDVPIVVRPSGTTRVDR
jgi:hypothetical protein